jgi:hypothetical protein
MLVSRERVRLALQCRDGIIEFNDECFGGSRIAFGIPTRSPLGLGKRGRVDVKYSGHDP